MDLIKEVQNKIAEKELYEQCGIDINEVYGISPADPLGNETRHERTAGERQWRAQAGARGPGSQEWRAPVQTDKAAAAPLSQQRGGQTSPQMGDTVILPQGGMGKVVKNFMGKITVEGPGGPVVVTAEQLAGPGKGPGGEMTWAIKR